MNRNVQEQRPYFQLDVCDDVMTERDIVSFIVHGDQQYSQVCDILSEECFTRGDHRIIYNAIRSLREEGKAITYPSVEERVHSQDGRINLFDYTNTQWIDPADARGLAARLDEIRRRRMVMMLCLEGYMKSSDMTTVNIHQEMTRIAEGITTASNLSGLSLTTSVELSKQRDYRILNPTGKSKGHRTGFSFLDSPKVCGGLKPDHLWVVSAPSSHGKTSISMSMMTNLSKEQVHSAYYSLEMSAEEIDDNRYSILSGVPFSSIRDENIMTEEEKRMYFDARNRYYYTDAYCHYDDSVTGWHSIINSIRQLRMEKGVEVAFIDYLQILPEIQSTNGNKTYAISQATYAFRALAKELNMCIVLVSQVTPTRDKTGVVSEPTENDLADSQSIFRAATNVLILWRPEFCFNPKPYTRNLADYSIYGTAQITVSKNRDGRPGGRFLVEFRGEQKEIRNIPFNELDNYKNGTPWDIDHKRMHDEQYGTSVSGQLTEEEERYDIEVMARSSKA